MASLYSGKLRSSKARGRRWVEMSRWYQFGKSIWELVCWLRSYRWVFRPSAVELQTHFVLGAGIGSASLTVKRANW